MRSVFSVFSVLLCLSVMSRAALGEGSTRCVLKDIPHLQHIDRSKTLGEWYHTYRTEDPNTSEYMSIATQTRIYKKDSNSDSTALGYQHNTYQIEVVYNRDENDMIIPGSTYTRSSCNKRELEQNDLCINDATYVGNDGETVEYIMDIDYDLYQLVYLCTGAEGGVCSPGHSSVSLLQRCPSQPLDESVMSNLTSMIPAECVSPEWMRETGWNITQEPECFSVECKSITRGSEYWVEPSTCAGSWITGSLCWVWCVAAMAVIVMVQ